MKKLNPKKKGIQLFVFNCMIIALLFAAGSCSDSSTGAMEPEPEDEPIPEVTTELFNSQFEIPEDLKITCLTGENEPGFPTTSECAVIKWMDHTYWALSFTDNRNSMAILAINTEGDIAERWDRDGDRYLWKIELDEEAEAAKFIGQANREIIVEWAELRVE